MREWKPGDRVYVLHAHANGADLPGKVLRRPWENFIKAHWVVELDGDGVLLPIMEDRLVDEAEYIERRKNRHR